MAMTGVLRPGHAAIRVLDLEEAVHHYRDIMGLVETGRDAQSNLLLSTSETTGTITLNVGEVRQLP